MKTRLLFVALTFSMIACGSKSGGSNSGIDAPGTTGDSGGPYIDAPPFNGGCTPNTSAPQCSNCMDDDGDGKIDGDDIECTSPFDNDENSFATGIPGDNIDPVMQDCFFDGNSGAGNDGCNIHVCCLLGAATKADCPIGANRYNPAECPPPIGTGTISQQCIATCGVLTPPGCDCFGCCTLCDATGCYDVATNPTTSPDCTDQTLGDPTKCLRCTKTDCGNTDCGGTTCILCPGQDPSTLDPSCNSTPTCPTGTTACDPAGACPAQTFCSNGCCIGVIQ